VTSAEREAVESVTTTVPDMARTLADDDVDQLGCAHDHPTDGRPVDRADDSRVSQGGRLQVTVGDRGRHLQPGAYLALDLDHRRDRVLDQQRLVDDRPAGARDRG